MNSLEEFQVRRVAVIGAGPTGLCATKYLKAQGSFDCIDVFEQQEQVGGLWNYTDQPPGPYPTPQTDPFFPADAAVTAEDGQTPVFPSAMYTKLHSNIPKDLMAFSDQSFDKDDWVYPSREATQRYLSKYAVDVRDNIRFSVQVTGIKHTPVQGKDKWTVQSKSVSNHETTSGVYDAVVIANGHYSAPFIPPVADITEFQKAYPDAIIHSKQYRSAESFRDKKVIVVGNGASGSDIALQINQVSRGLTLLSANKPTPPKTLEHIGCEEIAELEQFLVDNRAVRLKDGTVVTDIDAVVFCTGFLFNYPFLSDFQDKLITTGRGVHRLYKHLFYIDHPTLAFPGLNMNAVIWSVAEAQAAVLSAVWSNRLSLPAVDGMEAWSKELHEQRGEALHWFPGFTDGDYVNEMHDWAIQASHLGKVPPFWNDELFWQRRIFISAKILFEKDGVRARTLAELGQHYKPDWREYQT